MTCGYVPAAAEIMLDARSTSCAQVTEPSTRVAAYTVANFGWGSAEPVAHRDGRLGLVSSVRDTRPQSI
jgi:hypothetical protein